MRWPVVVAPQLGLNVVERRGKEQGCPVWSRAAQDDVGPGDFQEPGDAVAARRHFDGTPFHLGDCSEERLRVIGHAIALCAEVFHAHAGRQVRQRLLAAMIAGEGKIRQSALRRPILATLAPQCRMLDGSRSGSSQQEQTHGD